MAWLAELLLGLGPSEFAALLVLVCYIPVVLTRQSVLRALGASLIGMLIGLIGIHVDSGMPRFASSIELSTDVPAAFLPLALIVIPWFLRAQTEGQAALPLVGFLASPPWPGRILTVWRFLLLALMALHLAAIVLEYGNLGVIIAAVLGICGWILNRCGIPWPALYVAFTVAPMLEENFRRAMLLARGDFGALLERPVTVAVAAAILSAFAVRAHVFSSCSRIGRASNPSL